MKKYVWVRPLPPLLSTAAIRFDGLKSAIDQDVCYECSTCLRAAHCPSMPSLNLPTSLIIRGRCAGISAIPAPPTRPPASRAAERRNPRPTTSPSLWSQADRCRHRDWTAYARDVPSRHPEDHPGDRRAGVHKIEPHNPIHSMIANEATGDLKPEMLGERVLSAIIEIQVERNQLRGILRTLKEVAKEVDSVFCIDAFTVVEPGLKIPEEVLESIQAEGFTWRPNAKINMGSEGPGIGMAL